MSMFLKQLKNDFDNIADELDNKLADIPNSNESNAFISDVLEEASPIPNVEANTDDIITDYIGDTIQADNIFDMEEELNPIIPNEEDTLIHIEENRPVKEEDNNMLNKSEIQNETLAQTRAELWAFMKKWDSFTEEEQEEIIGDKNLLDDFTPEEAIQIVEEWEESKRVHIGDIIVCDGVKGICIGLNIPNPKKKDCFYYLVTNGGERPLYFDTENTIKTNESISLTI